MIINYNEKLHLGSKIHERTLRWNEVFTYGIYKNMQEWYA